jgi:hypothetical protein
MVNKIQNQPPNLHQWNPLEHNDYEFTEEDTDNRGNTTKYYKTDKLTDDLINIYKESDAYKKPNHGGYEAVLMRYYNCDIEKIKKLFKLKSYRKVIYELSKHEKNIDNIMNLIQCYEFNDFILLIEFLPNKKVIINYNIQFNLEN